MKTKGKRPKITKIAQLVPDDRNANRGTERGLGMLENSLRTYGAGRSILLDRHGKIIAGNKTVEMAGSLGFENVVVVESDGTSIVAVQRTDLDMDEDPARARALSIADNRVAEVDLDWNAEVLSELANDIDLTEFWKQDELDKLLAEPAEPKTATMDMGLTYSVIVNCSDEEKQAELLQRLEVEGYKCRLLIS